MKSKIIWDSGSFRDPEGRVFLKDGVVFRTLEDAAVERMEYLLKTPFFKKHTTEGRIIQTELLRNPFEQGKLPFTHLLKHRKISPIIYPYEWSFSMMKDAALLTLSVLKDCLENNFILKDGTAWNVAFHQGAMCFFDVLSIDNYEEGQTWEGYNQFCQELLYPLLLKGHKNVDFQCLLKGYLKGIDPCLMSSLFTLRDWFLAGVFKHVFLPSKLSQNKSISKDTVKNKIKLPKKSLLHMVEDMMSLVSSLKETSKNSTWIDYTENNTYKDSDLKTKENFILEFLKRTKEEDVVIDMGCNTGHFSRLTSQSHSVIACDIDSNCIDSLYRHIQRTGATNITPVVLDLMNPGSACGWRLQERSAIYDRLKANGFLALAVIHHLCIAQNIPIESFVSFLKTLAPRGVLEWVSKEDPMVQFLLRNRKDIFNHYGLPQFEAAICLHFKIKKMEKLNNGTRTLYWLESKE